MLGYKKKIEVLNYKDEALTLNLPGPDGKFSPLAA